jgi:hypothetical protein
MTYEVYSSGGIDCDLLQEPQWSDPPTDAEEDSNDASKQESNSACEAAEQVLPIIIHVPDCSVSSDSGSSDSNEPISRKARKLAVKMAAKKQTSQPKCNIRDYYIPISSAVHRNNVNAQMTPDVMNLWSVVAIGTSRDLDNTNNDAQSTTLIPEEATFKAVYFVRHPYDVVPSLANHNGKDIESTVAFFNDPDSAFINVKKKKNFAANQFYQHLGTWNEHVKSWLERPSFPVHFIRYEDMKMSPFDTFKKAIEFMELDYSDEQIHQALEMTKFENLRKQEEEKGFREKGSKTKFFFNKGEMNYGKSLLSEQQITHINTVNEEMMKHFGYWQ